MSYGAYLQNMSETLQQYVIDYADSIYANRSQIYALDPYISYMQKIEKFSKN